MDALETVLLVQEQKHHVNKGLCRESVPEFVGTISYQTADAVVGNNQLFNDYTMHIRSFSHGRYGHRIQYYLITRAIEDGLFDTSYLPLKTGILKYLTTTMTHYTFCFIEGAYLLEQSYWQLTIDNAPEKPLFNFPGSIATRTTSQDKEVLTSRWHLAGATEVYTYTTSKRAFDDWPYLATAVFASTFEANDTFNAFCEKVPQNAVSKFILRYTAGEHLTDTETREMVRCSAQVTFNHINYYRKTKQGSVESDAPPAFTIKTDTAKKCPEFYAIIRRNRGAR